MWDCKPAKYRPTFLSLLALLFALTLPDVAFGEQTAKDFFNRGKAEMGKGDWDGAIADFTKAIELNPKYAPSYVERGFAKEFKDDGGGAIIDFSKDVGLNQPCFLDRSHG